MQGPRPKTQLSSTGIAPVYQALLRLMNEPGDERKVVLLYGNKSPTDILLKDELDAMATAAAGLQPHVMEAATVCSSAAMEAAALCNGGCNPLPWRLRP